MGYARSIGTHSNHSPHPIQQVVDQDLFCDRLDRRPHGVESDQVQRIPDLHTILEVIQISQPPIKAVAGLDVEITQNRIRQRVRLLDQQMAVCGDQSGNFSEVREFQSDIPIVFVSSCSRGTENGVARRICKRGAVALNLPETSVFQALATIGCRCSATFDAASPWQTTETRAAA